MPHITNMQGENLKLRKECMKAQLKKGLTKPERLGPYGVLLMREGEFEKAIDIFGDIMRLKPQPVFRIKTRINRAIAYTKLGRIKEAKVALEDIHDKYKSRQVYEALGYLYVITDDEKAEEYNLEAYDYDPDNYVILDNLCQYYLQKGDYEKAREYGGKAYDIDDNKVDNLYHLAVIEAHYKNTEKAKEYCEDMMNAPLTGLNDITEDVRQKTYENIVGKSYEPDELDI